jgi:hypothetical protein
MSWFRRLFQQSNKQTEATSDDLHRDRLPSMPAVKFDFSTVSKNVKANLRRDIELLDDIGRKHASQVFEVALRSISVGGDLHLFYTELMSMKIEGMHRTRYEIGKGCPLELSSQHENFSYRTMSH